MNLLSTHIDTPVGRLYVTAGDDGIREIRWPNDTRPTAPDDGSTLGTSAVLVELARQLDEYFDGRRTEFDVPTDPRGTPFQLAAWRILREIPYGTTMTYGEQARRMGDPRKARAVGAANGRNPLSIIVPCHRVVGSNGKLTGFGGGLEAKAWLLDHEQRTLYASSTSGSAS